MLKSAILNVMLKAIEKATRHWRHDLLELEQLQVAGRSVGKFVAKSYIKTAGLLKQELTKARPKYGFISHEDSIKPCDDDPHCWIVEPLDGIPNFMRALPYVASSIALLKNEKPYACVIYTPFGQQLFWAEQGGGAFSQARRLRVSQRKEQADLLIGTNFSQEAWQLKVDHPSLHWRDWGCDTLSMVYTATGSLDAFISRGSTTLSKAAGTILIKEAGGVASNFQKNILNYPIQDIILSSESMQNVILSLGQDKKF